MNMNKDHSSQPKDPSRAKENSLESRNLQSQCRTPQCQHGPTRTWDRTQCQWQPRTVMESQSEQQTAQMRGVRWRDSELWEETSKCGLLLQHFSFFGLFLFITNYFAAAARHDDSHSSLSFPCPLFPLFNDDMTSCFPLSLPLTMIRQKMTMRRWWDREDSVWAGEGASKQVWPPSTVCFFHFFIFLLFNDAQQSHMMMTYKWWWGGDAMGVGIMM